MKQKKDAPKSEPGSYIPLDLFKSSLKNYEGNHFVKFLITQFGVEITNQLISQYYIGTSSLWLGATIFWQVDSLGRHRAGKIMLYDTTSCKRVKKPFNHITWVHKANKMSPFILNQCLFGEHLLSHNLSNHVAIVESEKTAIIASVYLPQFTWLATGGLNNLNPENCSILSGRRVVLFPDLNGFDKWTKKVRELSHIACFTTSDLLERKATQAERSQGLDLADYLLQLDYQAFREEPQQSNPQIIEVSQPPQKKSVTNDHKASWTLEDVETLRRFLSHQRLPKEPFQLDDCSRVIDCERFVESTLRWVTAHPGMKAYTPYYEQLLKMKEYIENSIN